MHSVMIKKYLLMSLLICVAAGGMAANSADASAGAGSGSIGYLGKIAAGAKGKVVFSRNALCDAVCKGRFEEVKGILIDLFLSHGRIHFDINATDEAGYALLHYAAMGGYVDIAELLLDRGAVVNLEVETLAGHLSGKTPLYYAVTKNHVSMIRLLLAHNADSAAEDQRGMTVLHHAAQAGCFERVKLLIDAGASVDAVSHNGSTVFDYAEQSGNADVIALVGSLMQPSYVVVGGHGKARCCCSIQ